MYAATLFQKPNKPRRRSRNVFELNLIFGGALAVLLRLLSKHPHAVTIVFDNEHELEMLREQFPDQQFLTFAMGEGETMYSLNPAHPTANSTTRGGFGQCVLNGALAAKDLLGSSDFEKCLQSLPDQGLIRCGGAVKLVEVHVYGSLAGAACSGASTVITRAMLPHLVKLGAPVEWHGNLLGPTTFLGIAQRARPNAASALLSQVKLVVDRDERTQLAAKSLMLHELPPYEDDIVRRNRHILMDAVVMQGQEMRDYLRLVRPNWANSGRFGSVLSRQVDLMTGLDSNQDMASWVAKQIQAELEAHFDAAEADPLLVDDIRWSDESEDHKRETVADIIANAEGFEASDLLDRLRKPPADHRFSLFAATAHGGEFQLERLSDDFAVTPHDFDEFLGRIRLLRTLDGLLANEASVVAQDLKTIDGNIAEIASGLDRLHDRLLRRKYISRTRLLRALERNAEQLRLQSDTRALRQAEAEAIQRAAVVVDQELHLHEKVITDIRDSLTPHIPRGSLQQAVQYVVPRHIADAFPTLLALGQQPPETQSEMLCSLAGQILPAGLAKIVGAANDRLEAIARKIVFGEYAIDAPPHGGRERPHSGTTIYSLPPIDDRTSEQLAALVRRFDRSAKLVRNDTLEFGATVARTRFYRFSSLQELYEGLLGADLYAAKTDRNAELNSSDGFEGLDYFDAEDGDGRIDFPPE